MWGQDSVVETASVLWAFFLQNVEASSRAHLSYSVGVGGKAAEE